MNSKKSIWCFVIGLLCLFLFISSITGSSPDGPKLKPITPLHQGPLSITSKFGLYETANSFVFSGSIKNSSNEDVLIQTLYFTFTYKNTIYRTDGYLNIVVPANETYNFYEATECFFYGEFYETEYHYVEVKINNSEEYLMHSNYSVIENKYQSYVNEEQAKFDREQETTKMFQIIMCLVAVALLLYSIYSFIGYLKNKKKGDIKNE